MASAEALAWAASVRPGLDPASAEPLPPSGSPRALTRLRGAGAGAVLVEHPLPAGPGANENDSFVYLAGHLRARSVPVPEVYAYDRARGRYLVEDLGDRDLYAEARASLGPAPGGEVPPGLRARYHEAAGVLLRLQVDGAGGFEPARTHNPPRYDRALMREWESGYFVRELLRGQLGLAPPAGLDAELDRLADAAAEAGTPWLLHRDFQSRNLKLAPAGLAVIDFQGARLGPPQYDLAALVLDPYAELPAALRAEVIGRYLDRLEARGAGRRESFLDRFPHVAAHRLMQALGAFAFLGHRLGKPGFLEHVPAALRLLAEVLDGLPAADVRLLRDAVADARDAGPGVEARA